MRTIDKDRLPDGAQYVVVLWCNSLAVPFSCIEKAVDSIRDAEVAFDCEVIRVDGDVCVWPIHVKGGRA